MQRAKSASCAWCGVAMVPRTGKRFCAPSHRTQAAVYLGRIVVDRACTECGAALPDTRRPGRPRVRCGSPQCEVSAKQGRDAEALAEREARLYEVLRYAGLADLGNPGMHEDQPAPRARLGAPDGAHDVDPRFGDWDWPAFVSEFGLCGDEVGQTNAGSPVAAGRVKGAVPAPCVMGLTLGAGCGS